MTRITWHEIPCVRLCIPFICGILAQQSISGLLPIFLGLAISVGFGGITLFTKTGIAKSRLRLITLTALLFSIGAFVRRAVEPGPSDIEALLSCEQTLCSIVQQAEATDYGSKCKLRIPAIRSHQRELKAIAYLRDSTIPLPGDTLFFPSTALQKIPPANNPFVFDVARFYQKQGIYLRCYLDSTNTILRRAQHRGLHILRRSAQVRESVTRIYQTHLHNKQSCAVLLAMTIGVEDWLDAGIYQAYAKSGAIHVLSISGLHVGIVSVLLYLLIGRSRQRDKLPVKLARAVGLICGIWAFACIAGLSPSITRAALMFSIYLFGTVIRRPVRGLNVLAASAFICLATDPYQINSVSFQFSYGALLGIVIFFKPLYSLIRARSKGVKFVWGTITMSIAAQVLLLPLLIHYFQQVSLISALSSLVAVPASYVILTGGIALIPMHYLIPQLAAIAGDALDAGIDVVNKMIVWMSTLPLSHVSNVYLSPQEVFLLSSVTILLALRTLVPYSKLTYCMLLASTVLALTHLWLRLKPPVPEILAIYPHRSHVLIDFIRSGTCHSTFSLDTLQPYLAQEVRNFRNATRIRRTASLPTAQTGSDRKLCIIDLPARDDTISTRIAILREPDFGLLGPQLISLNAEWLVLSAGLHRLMRQAAGDFCIRQQQNFHDSREHGTLYLIKYTHNGRYEKLQQDISG